LRRGGFDTGEMYEHTEVTCAFPAQSPLSLVSSLSLSHLLKKSVNKALVVHVAEGRAARCEGAVLSKPDHAVHLTSKQNKIHDNFCQNIINKIDFH